MGRDGDRSLSVHKGVWQYEMKAYRRLVWRVVFVGNAMGKGRLMDPARCESISPQQHAAHISK